jgi:hypothetical protein
VNNNASNILKNKEAGTSLVEFVLAFPVLLITVSGTISFLLLMFNVLGAHIAIFTTLREVAVEVPAMQLAATENTQSAGAFASKQIRAKLGGLTSKSYVSDVEFAVNGGEPCKISKENQAGCEDIQINPGDFFSISIPVNFIDFSTLGLPPLSLTAFATMKIQENDV